MYGVQFVQFITIATANISIHYYIYLLFRRHDMLSIEFSVRTIVNIAAVVSAAYHYIYYFVVLI